jgi:predicted signal transduction protein with EAL and GGDEF domain
MPSFLVERLKDFLARPARARRPFAVTAGCVLLVCLIGYLDYATGTEARVFPLYYLPIAAGALLVSRAVGLGLAAFSSIFWVLSMYWGGSTWSIGMFTFNAVTQMASFGLIALLVGSLVRRFEVERDLSRTDALTSLPNGRPFYEIAAVLIAGARRSGRPFTLAYVDLDNFKAVNDARGHLRGTRHSGRWPRSFVTRPGPVTWPRDSAGTSSRSCCPTPDPNRREPCSKGCWP